MSDVLTSKPEKNINWLYDLLFVVVLLVAAVLRFTGSDWGDLLHQHPDELFFSSVTLDIGTPSSLAGVPPPTTDSQRSSKSPRPPT